jgi:IS30 family transposase
MDHINPTTFTPDRERGQHLKFEDRCSIKIFMKLHYSYRQTAEALNCSPSTVMYEVRRGTGKRKGSRGRHPEYSAKRGQINYETNRSRCHKEHKLTRDNPFIDWIAVKVRKHSWSLDACVGYARRHRKFPKEQIPCTKTLYNELWAGNLPLNPFDVPEALSRKPKKERHRENKRILGASIDERPEIAALRIECGHWEIDTVVGRKAGRESVVLTIVEKKTDYYIAVKIPGKDADSVMTALEVLREELGEAYFAEVFKTITADNGSEFERLAELKAWGVGIYFAHPYTSWERSQNERHNRLFRRYVPKGVSIENYTAEQILWYADEMNGLPRKHLDYATPEELFNEFLDQVYSVVKVHVT